MPQYVRDGGVWKPVKKKFIRDAGVWKPVSAGFIRDAGVWKKFLASEVEYVGDAANNGASVTTPSETLAGDLLVVYITGLTLPTIPSGWTLITQHTNSSRSGRLIWRFADADGVQTLTGFSSAQWTSVSVFRNAEVGASASTQSNNFNLSAPTPNLNNTDDTSWVLLAVTTNGSLFNHGAGPAPYQIRQTWNGGPIASLRDTNGPVASAPAGNITMPFSNPSIGLAVEIKVAS